MSAVTEQYRPPDNPQQRPAVTQTWPPAAGPAQPPRQRRRWPWAVAVVLLVAVSAGAAVVAWDQRSTAAEWRDRAQALEEQRDEALGLGDDLRGQLTEVLGVLELSEDDVARLEARIRELADETAQAQDTATTVQVERDVLLEVSGRVASAVDSLDACVTRLFDLLGDSVAAYNAAAAGDVVDVVPLNAAAEATTSFCNDARSAAASAAAAAEQLQRR